METTLPEYISDLIREATEIKQAIVRTHEFMKHTKFSLSKARLQRVHDCRNFIKYVHGEDAETGETHSKPLRTETCGHRLCPGCQRADAIKDGIRLYTCLKYLQQEKHKRLIFMTLTTPNVVGDELKTTMREMNRAYDKLMRRKQFLQFSSSVAKMEITYNAKANTYHPHLHVILVVDADYFDRTNADYLTHDQLLEHWQSVTNNKAITQVDIRAVKESADENEKDPFAKAVLELSKYTAKSYDYANYNQDVFDTFLTSLHGAKTLRVAGELRMLVNVYDIDRWGLLDAYKPKSETFEDYDKKTVSTYNFKRKEYDTLLTDLSKDELAEVLRRERTGTYEEFRNEWKHLGMDFQQATFGLMEQNEQLARHKASRQNKIVLAGTEAKIKTFKQRQQRLKRRLEVYKYIDDNLRDNFVY